MKKQFVYLFIAVAFMFNMCIGVSSVSAEETVLIGLNVPLSGSYQYQGEDELKAYKLAIEELNKKGGILKKKVIY